MRDTPGCLMKLISQDDEVGIDAVKLRYREFQEPRCQEWLQRASIEICNLLDQVSEIDDPTAWYWHTSHSSLCLNRRPNPPETVIMISSSGDGHTLAKVFAVEQRPISKTDVGCF